MRYFIGTPEQAFKNHKIQKELSRALYETHTRPDYSDQVLFIYDDQDNLIRTKSIGDNNFLNIKVWFYKELHHVQETYGYRGWPYKETISYPRLERELKDRLLK